MRTQEFKKNYRKKTLGKKRGPQSEEHRLRKSLAQQGEKGSNYKGGITLLAQLIRHCFKYAEWRKNVFTKNNFTCIECKDRSKKEHAVYLEAHHVKYFSQIIREHNITTFEQAMECEELWNVNNGVTLCRKCHNKTKIKREEKCN